MKTMSWREIDSDWVGLKKKHRSEIAQAVARYCIGHSMEELADHLSYSVQWMRAQLDHAGLSEALRGSKDLIPLTGATSDVSKEVPKLIKEYGPTKAEQESEDFEPYLDHYKAEGHNDASATRLAKAEWAGEAAVEAGVIKESRNKRNEKVNKITFPEHDEDTFAMDLNLHTARVEAAARFLDNAKMSNLRKESTCEKVASANVKWLEQVERIRNLHPTFV